MSEHLHEHELKRSLTLFDVIGLGVNAVIGQGIFLLPGVAAGLLGPASVAALMIASFLALLIALCFAEVGSRFKSTGGSYIYAREAFGSVPGYVVGWMLCVVCVVSWAVLANGFTLVLGHFFPEVTSGWLQPVVAITLMTLMVVVNLTSAKVAGTFSTICSVAKVIPILVFVGVGLYSFDADKFAPFAPNGWDNLGQTVLILLYMLVGFETSVVPAGEMENPKKAVPTALISVMVLVVVIYLGVMVACFSLHPHLADAKNPVTDAATVFFGSIGGSLIAAGIVLSSLGVNAAQALVGPRNLFAMAERGDLPEFLSHVDARTGVPRNAVIVAYLASVVLTLSGTFYQLVQLGVLARFVQYLATCGALFVYRRRDRAEGVTMGFRIPGGEMVAALTILLIFWLISQTSWDSLKMGLVLLLMAFPMYAVTRDTSPPEDSP